MDQGVKTEITLTGGRPSETFIIQSQYTGGLSDCELKAVEANLQDNQHFKGISNEISETYCVSSCK